MHGGSVMTYPDFLYTVSQTPLSDCQGGLIVPKTTTPIVKNYLDPEIYLNTHEEFFTFTDIDTCDRYNVNTFFGDDSAANP